MGNIKADPFHQPAVSRGDNVVTIQFQPGSAITYQGNITTPSLAAAGRRVIAQTLGAFLTEKLLPDEAVIASPPRGKSGDVLIETADPAIVYRAHVKRTIAYDRWLVNEHKIWRQIGSDHAPCDDPLCFLDDLLPLLVGDDSTHARFRDEIFRTFLNHAQSLENGKDKWQPLAGLAYDSAEACLTDGHRYHPSFKSRIGFTPRENRTYGPEFANNLKPIWLAVHCDLTNSASIALPGGQDRTLLSAADAPSLEDDYHILPVHPWQWERELEAATIVERVSGRIKFLGETSHNYLAQQSIRTLSDRTSLNAPTLKLALSIRNTSTSRTLAAHTVLNAPIISAWLREVSQHDAYLSSAGTVFLLESMGTTVSLPSQQDPHGLLRGSMAAIWRDPVHKYLDTSTEQASPFSMLTHLDFDGQPAIRQWLEAYGVENWTRALLKVAAIPVVHLLIACGIALESHQQNMLLIHRNGWPLRVALKDFHDGVRFVPQLLRTTAPTLVATPAEHAQVNPNSYVESSDPEDVRDFMFDALFGVNLAELAFFLERHFAFEERSFWRLAADTIKEHLEADDLWQAGAHDFKLLNHDVVVEDLARRRLQNGLVPARRVANPLVFASHQIEGAE